MTGFVFLIEQVALGLYILTAIGLVLAWRSIRAAQRDLKATHFELEREIFRYRRSNAITRFILLVEFGLVILGVQFVVAPIVRTETDTSLTIDQVAEDGVFDTPTPPPVAFGNSPIDPSGVQIGDEEIVRVLATPTLTPTPVGTILPNAAPVVGCDTPNATLQMPANGLVVHEPITVIGSAFVDDFAFYRFELKGVSTFDNFAVMNVYDQPVAEVSTLGQFVPSFFEPGDYQFRVVVFDITNTVKATCTVNIRISDPIPTATPIGQ